LRSLWTRYVGTKPELNRAARPSSVGLFCSPPLSLQRKLPKLGIAAIRTDAGHSGLILSIQNSAFSAQHQQTTMLGSKRVKTTQPQGAIDLLQLLANQFSVHRAHDGALGLQKTLVNTWPHTDGQILAVDDRIHAGIVKMFVEHIQLVGCVIVECLAVIQIRGYTAQHLTASASLFSTFLCSRAVLTVLHWPIPHRRPTATAGIDRRANQKS